MPLRLGRAGRLLVPILGADFELMDRPSFPATEIQNQQSKNIHDEVSCD